MKSSGGIDWWVSGRRKNRLAVVVSLGSFWDHVHCGFVVDRCNESQAQGT